MYLIIILISFFSLKATAISVALFDHQIDKKFNLEHRISNYNASISSSNNHSSHLLCGLKPKIKLYLYPFLEYKNNEVYFKFLKEAIQKSVDYIWIPSSSSISSEKELALLTIAKNKNIKIITSAGNESTNLELNPRYPCSYKLDNIVCIQTQEKFSNYTPKSYKIKDSSLLDCDGKLQKGTSQATVIYLNQLLN